MRLRGRILGFVQVYYRGYGFRGSRVVVSLLNYAVWGAVFGVGA